MTAIVDGGESARSTAPPRSAVASRAAGEYSEVKDRTSVRRYRAPDRSAKAMTRIPPAVERIGLRRGLISLR
jgi:hypothetical protein